MFLTRFRGAAAGLMIGLTAALAGCAGDNEAEMETPVAGDVAMNELDIEEVNLGRAIGVDMRVTEMISDFAPGDSVYASVRLDGTATTGTIMARWMTEGDSLVHEETKTISLAGEQWAWFALGTETLPEGDYELKLYVNGEEEEEREFSIERRGT